MKVRTYSSRLAKHMSCLIITDNVNSIKKKTAGKTPDKLQQTAG